MIILKAKKRDKLAKKVKEIRNRGGLPAVLYGPKIKNQSIEINLKEFKKTFKEAGESSLISLEIDNKKFPVLVHEIKRDSLTGEPTHIDFYQPILTERVRVAVPLIFEGMAPAVKELGGTLVREIQEIEVEALPEKLPHEIKINVESLKTFEDEILIKDLNLPQDVKVLRSSDDIVALVVPPTKVEEELEKPIEEKVEEVEKAEEKKEKEGEEEEVKAEKIKETPEKPEKKEKAQS